MASSAGLRIPRAGNEALRHIFEKFASIEEQGQRFMTADDFIRRYLGLFNEPNYNKETVRLLARACGAGKEDRISLEDFALFEALLCSPDALHLTAFNIFRSNLDKKTISYEEFIKVVKHAQSLIKDFHFDFNNSSLLKRYFGDAKAGEIGYYEFCRLLHDFCDEQSTQAFHHFDRKNTGFISLVHFLQIMSTVNGYLLTDFVRNNLVAVSGLSGGSTSHKVSFPYYAAFTSLLTKMELMKQVYLTQSRGNLQMDVSREDFVQAAQNYAQITPYEVEILFRLAELAHPGQRTLSFKDLERIDPERGQRSGGYEKRDGKAVENKGERGFVTALLESLYRFGLGSIAGAMGATAVYPIDLVKTRMQNQRSVSFIGEVAYKNSVLGLYRGLLPQIVGVAPEKAIKLTMNDFVRDHLTKDGRIPVWAEILAGACAGGSQVVFTNPLEIVKIRLQVAGEIQSTTKVNVFTVLRDLGLGGLYRGARACFLRDIPFSAIYFPVYAHAKTATADAGGRNGVLSLFASAFIAGVPAAGLVTPADVIKTRLQVQARAGQTTYSGVLDCFRKEGQRALWKGAGARVCRSSPQFAVTLLTYELLQRYLRVDFGGSQPTGSETPAPLLMERRSDNPLHVGGYRLAKATFQGIETRFGLFLPHFEHRHHRPAYAPS